jgi:hypothetical protein
MDAAYGFAFEWRILDNGDLLILDDPKGVAHTTLRLSMLTRDSATVLNIATLQTLDFSRRYKGP